MLIGLGKTGLGVPSFAETNATNAQANWDLAKLANAVVAYMAGKGYSAYTVLRAGGTGGQYLLTDVYEVYVNNVPAYAGKIAGIITASDLSTSASQLGNGFLSSLEWNAMYAGKTVEYPTTAQNGVIPGSGKQEEVYKPAGEASGGQTPMSIEDLYAAWVSGTYTGAITGVQQQQLNRMYAERHPAMESTTTVVPAENVTSVANGTATTKDVAYYMDMLKQSDIISGVPNWAILLGAAGLLYFMNQSHGRR